MRRTTRSIRRACRSALCLVLVAVLITGTFHAGLIWTSASAQERVFDIGVDAESVTAVLDGDGLLTVSGSGAIQDYTPATAPFAGLGITALKLGADITAIGSYAFYNCPGITGTLELPAGLARLGDGAFSGDSPALAASPNFVRNSFTDLLVTKRREEVTSSAGLTAQAQELASSALEDEEETQTPAAEDEESAAAEEESEEAQERAEEEEQEEAQEAEEEEAESGAEDEAEDSEDEDDGEDEEGQDDEDENQYVIQRITQQEIGEGVFAQREDSPGFYCSEENESFRAAMIAAGYQEIESLIPVTLDPGEGSCGQDAALALDLPVADGEVRLPRVPECFEAPAGDSLFTYAFGGWTEYEDEAGVVRPAGSSYTVGDREELYLIANWDRTVQAAIRWTRSEGDVILTVPAISGYTVTAYLWQTCLPEAGVDEDQLSWEDLDEEGDTLRWTLSEDETRLFRCQISVRKQRSLLKRLFSAQAAAQTVSLAAVRVAAARTARSAYAGTVIALDANGGTVPSGAEESLTAQGDGMALAPECAFTAPSGTVFCGWTDSLDYPTTEGTHYDPGDEVDASQVSQLTAKWKAPAVLAYVDAAARTSDSGDGTAGNPWSLSKAFYEIKTNGSPDTSAEGIYRNILVAAEDFSLPAELSVGASDGSAVASVSSGDVMSFPWTLAAAAPGASAVQRTLSLPDGARLWADTRFEGITLSLTAEKALSAAGFQCVMGKGVSVSGGPLILYGADASQASTGTGTDVRAFAGTYGGVYGGGQYAWTGDTRVVVAGSASVTGGVYGAGRGTDTASAAVTGDTAVFIAGAVGGSVYGGGETAKAALTGDATVVVAGGAVTGSVYGGGNAGSSEGASAVSMTGGSIGGSLYGGGQGSGATLSGDTSVSLYGGTVTGSVYGGGSAGAVTGQAALLGEGGTVSGGVFLGGESGEVQGTDSHTLTLSGVTVQQSVYGGGDTAALRGPAVVSLTGGAVGGSVYGGGNRAAIGGASSVTVSGTQVTGSVYGGGNAGAVPAGATARITGEAQVGGSVYGGGKSAQVGATSAHAVSVTVTGDSSVTGSVYGGGETGACTGSATVAVTEAAVTGDVFGGGKGQALAAGETTDTVTAGQIGGGATVTVTDSTVTGSVFGGGENQSAAVTGDTAVTIDNEDETVASVYGGGDQASVGGDARVTFSGVALGNLYGGGKGDASDETVGQVSGDASALLTGGRIGSYTGEGVLRDGSGNLFGGGQYAQVGGDTTVTVRVESLTGNPAVGGSVYGGGLAAPVAGSATVSLEAGRVGQNVYGGGKAFAASVGSASVTVSSARAAEDGAEYTVVGGGVYGGGALGQVAGSATVAVQGGVMKNVYGGGEGQTDITGNGVEPGRVMTGTTVTVAGAYTQVTGAVYGGGDQGIVGAGDDRTQDAAERSAQVQVTISGGQIGKVFGGGAGCASNETLGAVFGDTAVTITGGAVAGSVFGAGNYAAVTGDTQVTAQPTAGAVSIGGGLYGGGNLNSDPESGFDSAACLVDGDAAVVFDGGGTGAYAATLGGAVVGGGNLSQVGGTRTVTVQHYDGEITSFQRADTVRLWDCQIALLGADDPGDSRGGEAFALSQLGDLRLAATTLTLEAGVQELGGLGNYQIGAGDAWTASDSETGRSKLVAAPGALIRVATTASGQTVYGHISGVLTLERDGDDTDDPEQGVRLQADLTSEIGTAAQAGEEQEDTGALVKSAANTGLSMVTGEVSGIYRYWRLGGSTVRREITLTASDSGDAWIERIGTAVNSDYNNSFFLLTDVKKTAGEFYLLQPEAENGAWALPAFEDGQTAANSFALLVAPSSESQVSGSGQIWTNLSQSGEGSAIVSSDGAGGHWTDDQGQAVLLGQAYPATGALGQEAPWTFTLICASGASAFTGGELEVTLQEYVAAAGTQDPATALEGDTVIVHVAIQRDESAVSQTAAVAAGRKFSGVTGTSAVTVTGNSAVTALFQTTYYPSGETGGAKLYLCQAGATVPFPTGTQLVLGDLSNSSAASYYYYQSSGQTGAPLSGFSNLNATVGGTYPGPSAVGELTTERLLFAVDFSDTAGLAQGEYYLALVHQAAEDPTALEESAVASFTVAADGSCSLTMALASATVGESVSLNVAAVAPAADTRYADGATLRLTLKDSDDQTLPFPVKAGITVDGAAAGNALWDKSGAVAFSIAVSENAVDTHVVTLDLAKVADAVFSDFNGSVTIQAAMTPLVGLQVGSDSASPDATASLAAVFYRNMTQDRQRSIALELDGSSDRVLDVSQVAAEMAFTLSYAGAQSGDLIQAEILYKTGDTPAAASYSAASGGGSWIALETSTPSTDEGQQTTGLTVTVPQGTESGTYRLRVWLQNGAGSVLEEDVFNFIVR